MGTVYTAIVLDDQNVVLERIYLAKDYDAAALSAWDYDSARGFTEQSRRFWEAVRVCNRSAEGLEEEDEPWGNALAWADGAKLLVELEAIEAEYEWPERRELAGCLRSERGRSARVFLFGD